MPKLTIDDVEVDAQDGLNIIQAAAQVGIDIPHFCYHPGLSIVAQCRQCLVEVEGVPKVMPACNTFVRDGLIVRTNSEKAVTARRATVEFTLINHPLDCPICDKGGECPLQLTTFTHGPGYSRFDGPEEKKVRKKYFLSDRIMYDPNRCIMCTRCVRFTDEVTKTGELGFNNRGFRKKIVVFPGKKLDNELAGNVIDLCPVGALLSRDNLHEERVWYWRFIDTVCPLCSNGCNITAGVDPRKGYLARVRPRANPDVNQYWICDRGRYEFKGLQKSERIREPMLRKGEGFERATWEEAVEKTASKLREIIKREPGGIAILCSALLTNEEAYLLKKLSTLAGIPGLTAKVGDEGGEGGGGGEKKFGIISEDPYPNSAGVKRLGIDCGGEALSAVIQRLLGGELRAVLAIGLDLPELVNDIDKPRVKDALSKLELLAVLDYRITETARMATVVLPGATPYEKEGTFTNDQGRVQRVRRAISPPGDAMEDWEILALLGRKLDDQSFSYGSPEEIMDEMSKRVPSMRGLSYEKIGALGTASHE